MEKLPKVYANQIQEDISNNKNMYYSRLIEKENSKNILKEIDHIFGDRDFVYKKRVEITTKDEVFEVDIVGKSGSDLLTLDGKRISIPSILDIKKL